MSQTHFSFWSRRQSSLSQRTKKESMKTKKKQVDKLNGESEREREAISLIVLSSLNFQLLIRKCKRHFVSVFFFIDFINGNRYSYAQHKAKHIVKCRDQKKKEKSIKLLITYSVRPNGCAMQIDLYFHQIEWHADDRFVSHEA